MTHQSKSVTTGTDPWADAPTVATTPLWTPHDDRLKIPDEVPIPPQGVAPFPDGFGGFGREDGCRTIMATVGMAECWTMQIANGELVQNPYVALDQPISENAWSPSQARAIAHDILRAADLAEQWENWSPASAQLEEPDQR